MNLWSRVYILRVGIAHECTVLLVLCEFRAAYSIFNMAIESIMMRSVFKIVLG